MPENEKLILHKNAETSFIPFFLPPFYFLPIPYSTRARDIEVSKPDGIFNKAMVFGTVLAGVLALAIPAVPTFGAFALSTIAGGLLMGIVGEMTAEKNYSLALKQQSERSAQMEMMRAQQPERMQEQSQAISQYKNIPDLPAIPEPEAQHKQETAIEPTKQSGESIEKWTKSIAKSAAIQSIANNISF